MYTYTHAPCVYTHIICIHTQTNILHKKFAYARSVMVRRYINVVMLYT